MTYANIESAVWGIRAYVAPLVFIIAFEFLK
jgi:hypothetical protein